VKNRETLKLKTGFFVCQANGPGTATLMRVHASPNLNKKSEALDRFLDIFYPQVFVQGCLDE
jgi:hypothetical protein